MSSPAGAPACSALEALACTQQESVLRQFYGFGPRAVQGPAGYICRQGRLDLFEVPYSDEFALDGPLLMAVLADLAATDPDAALQLVAPPEGLPVGPISQGHAERTFDAVWKSFLDSLLGGGNLPGNLHGNLEAALRAAWRKQALQGFQALRSGGRQSVALGQHISLTVTRVGARGDIRPGARIRVLVRNLPVKVIHQLPQPFTPSHGGRVGQLRVHPLDLPKLSTAADAIADARLKSTRFLRGAGTRLGGGILAFGPSAAIDFYNSSNYQNGDFRFDRNDFLIRSAKSQSGNLVGVASGAAVSAGVVALGLVSAVGWPVILIGLGAGIVAQTVWGATGMDEAAGDLAKSALR